MLIRRQTALAAIMALFAFATAAEAATAPAKPPSAWSLCKASGKKHVADAQKIQQCSAVIDAAANGDKKAAKRLARAYFHRGVAYNGTNDHAKALADLGQAIKLEPKFARAWYQRGNVQSDLLAFDLAIADYSEALKLKPKNGRAFANRCRARALAGKDLAAALADCDQSLALRPKNNGRALNARGLVHYRSGAWDNAIADFNGALAELPKSAGALYVRGLAKLKKGDKSGGNADVTAAKGFDAGVAQRFAALGVTP